MSKIDLHVEGSGSWKLLRGAFPLSTCRSIWAAGLQRRGCSRRVANRAPREARRRCWTWWTSASLLATRPCGLSGGVVAGLWALTTCADSSLQAKTACVSVRNPVSDCVFSCVGVLVVRQVCGDETAWAPYKGVREGCLEGVLGAQVPGGEAGARRT